MSDAELGDCLSANIDDAKLEWFISLWSMYEQRKGRGESGDDIFADIEQQLQEQNDGLADVWVHALRRTATGSNYLHSDVKYRVLVDWLVRWNEAIEQKGRIPQSAYIDLKRVGEGGFGVVYQAWDPNLKKKVAIKIPVVTKPVDDWITFQPEVQKQFRFLEGVNQQSKVAIPGVVPVLMHNLPTSHDIDSLLTHLRDAPIWFSMDFIEGGNLRTWFKSKSENGDPIPPSEVLMVMEQVAKRLQLVHASDRIHKDVKPENILLDRNGSAWLTDFDLATQRLEQQVHGNMFSGSKYYAAPEIWAGREATAKTDIWAWGTMLYELLAGELPFNSDERILDVDCQIPRLRTVRTDVPAYLDNIVDKCLRRDESHRYSNFSEILDELRVSESNGAATSNSWASAFRYVLTAILVLTTLTLVLSAVALWRSSTSPESVDLTRSTEPQLSATVVYSKGEKPAKLFDVPVPIRTGSYLRFEATLEEGAFGYLVPIDETGLVSREVASWAESKGTLSIPIDDGSLGKKHAELGGGSGVLICMLLKSKSPLDTGKLYDSIDASLSGVGPLKLSLMKVNSNEGEPEYGGWAITSYVNGNVVTTVKQKRTFTTNTIRADVGIAEIIEKLGTGVEGLGDWSHLEAIAIPTLNPDDF